VDNVSLAYSPPEDWTPLPRRKYALYNALKSSIYDKEQLNLATLMGYAAKKFSL